MPLKAVLVFFKELSVKTAEYRQMTSPSKHSSDQNQQLKH